MQLFLPRRLGAAVAVVGLAVGLSACDPVVNIVSMASCTNGKPSCYQPATASVPSGSRVVFKNKDGVGHTVTRCTMPACPVSGGTGHDTGFGSATIPAGGTYTFVFHGKGTYAYYCRIHGYTTMHGTITVT